MEKFLLQDDVGQVWVGSHGGPYEVLAADPADLMVLTPVLQVTRAVVLQEHLSHFDKKYFTISE